MKNRHRIVKGISLLLVISMLTGATTVRTMAGDSGAGGKSVQSETTAPPKADYSRITMEDYGIEAPIDEEGKTYNAYLEGTYTGESLNKTYLDVDVAFDFVEEYDMFFDFLGSANWLNNIRFKPFSSGYSVAHTGGVDVGSTWVSCTNSGFVNVKLYTDIIENATDATKNDITIKVYIQNELKETLAWTEDKGVEHNKFYFVCNTGSYTLRTPEFDGYTRITMEDYGIEAPIDEKGKTYNAYLEGTYTGESLNKTYLDVDVAFDFVEEYDMFFDFLGSANWLNNIRFKPFSSGYSVAHTGGVDIGSTWISCTNSGFVNVKLYTDILENTKDDTKNDVIIEVYIENELKETLAWTEDKGVDHHKFYFVCNTGSYTLRTPVIEGAVPENPENPENPEEPEYPENPERPGNPDDTVKPELSEALKGYKRVTTNDFAMIDEVFTNGWNEINWMGYGVPDDVSLDHTYFDADVALCDDESFQNTIRYLSIDGWQSLQIGISGGEIKIYETTTNTYLYGVALSELDIAADTYFNLKLRVDIAEHATNSNKKDVTLGLWINGQFVPALSGENYAVISGCDAVGNMLGVYVPNEGTIRMKSAKAEGDAQQKPIVSLQPDASFKKITFGSFDMANGTYKDIGPALGTQGSYILSLNETVFSGNLHFSKEKGADFRYGGKNNPWNGLCFWTTGDGKLYMQDAEDITAGKTNVYTFHPMYAGVQLVDNTFNMKLSMQFVDRDQDGKEDDVKLGVWFDNMLYKNEYIYLIDYAPKVGSDCSVYVQPSEAWIAIWGDESVYTGVDFTLFGFTQSWKKEIGIKK